MSSEQARPFIHRYRSGITRAPLAGTLKLVLLTLAEFANEDGGDCFPAIATVAGFAGVNEKTVRRLLQAPTPWLTRTPRTGTGQAWRSYGYQLVIPEGADTRPARWKDRETEGADMTPSPFPEGADTTPAGNQERCGHSSEKVRTLDPEGAGMVSDDVGIDIGKSSKALKHAETDSLPGDPIFIELRAKGGHQVAVTEQELRSLQALYPRLDVPQALRNMQGWLVTNPTKAKTPGGMPRFIRAWLTRQTTQPATGPRAPAVVGQLPRDSQAVIDATNATAFKRLGLSHA